MYGSVASWMLIFPPVACIEFRFVSAVRRCVIMRGFRSTRKAATSGNPAWRDWIPFPPLIDSFVGSVRFGSEEGVRKRRLIEALIGSPARHLIKPRRESALHPSSSGTEPRSPIGTGPCGNGAGVGDPTPTTRAGSPIDPELEPAGPQHSGSSRSERSDMKFSTESANFNVHFAGQGVLKSEISRKSGNSTDFLRAVWKYRKISEEDLEFFHFLVILVAI